MLLFEDFVVNDNTVILYGENSSGLFEIDKSNWKTQLIYFLEDNLLTRKYSRCLQYENKIFLSQWWQRIFWYMMCKDIKFKE